MEWLIIAEFVAYTTVSSMNQRSIIHGLPNATINVGTRYPK